MKKIILTGVLLAAVAAGGWYLYRDGRSGGLPDYVAGSNGRLALARFDVAALYGGRVEAVLVEEGEDVAAGAVLVQLSSDTADSRVAEARAAVAQAEAAERQARGALVGAEARIAAQRQQQAAAQIEWDNAAKLQREDLVSPAETQRRKSQRDSAAAGVKAAQAGKAEAAAAVAQAGAAVERARAQLRAAESAGSDMRITTPQAGRVEYRLAAAGNVVAPGSKVVSLIDPADVYMNIFLPNPVVGRLKVGDEARIVPDGAEMVLPAQIRFIAAEAQFTPKAVETRSEREKLMFKVKLQVPQAVALQYRGLLKGGMTGNGYVRTDASREWPQELAVKLPE
ncbi:HlyD family secretion protein [Neisseria leonii]|uniref:HlyD family secretion protein n=1 Tax=Neisseria leonii TaxID=2995413 RepID=UPI00237A4881|nr:HlyD family efflux transporter periplasmic adaptor subunit [Neisseria sp. 3986]MDD9325290.1 HlyD family efflux transporter periplasmic adaptor subunit [Neisseria sp. 3986]